MAARAAIAIRIGIKGEEELSSAVDWELTGWPAERLPACWLLPLWPLPVAVEPLPWPPEPVLAPPPVLGLLFAAEGLPPAPDPDPFDGFEPVEDGLPPDDD
jgi:hypothetical protein